MTITRELADKITGTRFGDLPDQAIEVARQVALDGIGCMIAGLREPSGLGPLTIRYLRMLGGPQESTVIGAGFKSAAPNAAYANGTLCHALDFDNTWYPVNHPTSPTLPAILALAERNKLSGRDVVLALVLAFEVQGRMRVASARVGAGSPFHKPGVSGTMGATTASGKLLGLSAEQLCMAYGIAGSRCGSITANHGTMTKPSHSGHAARMGVEAAMLAEIGFTGAADVFGAGKFFDTFYGAENVDLDLFLKDFGAPYRMIEPGVGFKLYPSNYHTHRPIDSALKIRKVHGIEPQDIERVEIDVPDTPYVDRPKPKKGLEGKFSYQYATAAALLDGQVGIESFSDERRFAPDMESLLDRTKTVVRADIPADFNTMWTVVRVFTKDGRSVEERCDRPDGLWGAPLPREARLDKFRLCTAPSLPEEAIAEAIDLVERLEDLPNLQALTAILSRVKAAPAKAEAA